MNKVIQHIWNEIRAVNTLQVTPVFDRENPIRSTSDVRTWWTSRPCEPFEKSHINFVVVDQRWEYLEAKTINDSDFVKSFVKNDHLNFVVYYNFQGVTRRYFPDFIIKLTNGENLIVETKGQDSDQNKTKRAYLDEWCRAVNQHGGFGNWSWAVSFDPNDLEEILFNSFNNKNLSNLKSKNMTAELIVSMIDASMRAIDLWLKFKDRGETKKIINEMDSLQLSPSVRQEAQTLQALIPTDILDMFSNRVQTCFDRYKLVLDDDSFLPSEIDDATEAVKKCICRELKRLYSINGSIPLGTLSNYWSQYNCEVN